MFAMVAELKAVSDKREKLGTGFGSCMLFSGCWQSVTCVICSTWFVAVTVMYRKKEKTHPKEIKPLTLCQQTTKQSPSSKNS